MNILAEINCLGQCLKLSDLAPYITLFLVLAIALVAASLIIKNPGQRLIAFIGGQLTILIAIAVSFYIMKCSEMLTFYLYLIYVATSSALIFAVVRFYDRIMIKRLNAKPAGNILKWAQEFVDGLTHQARIYYFDSAVPRAFAAGRTIFVSIGLLELLDDQELKAVLAHEAWHIRINSRMPYFKQLALMTFSPIKKSELEALADNFAAKIAGNTALSSARNKVDKVFI